MFWWRGTVVAVDSSPTLAHAHVDRDCVGFREVGILARRDFGVRSDDDDSRKEEGQKRKKRVTQASRSISGSRFGGIPAVARCLRSVRPNLRSKPGGGWFRVVLPFISGGLACCFRSFAGGRRARCVSLFLSRITATRHLGKEVLAIEEQENRHLWAELECVVSQWDS